MMRQQNAVVDNWRDTCRIMARNSSAARPRNDCGLRILILRQFFQFFLLAVIMRLCNALSLVTYFVIAEGRAKESHYRPWELFGIHRKSQSTCAVLFSSDDINTNPALERTNDLINAEAKNETVVRMEKECEPPLGDRTEREAKETHSANDLITPQIATTDEGTSTPEEILQESPVEAIHSAVEIELPGMDEKILPGSSSNDRELILIKLSKRIAAIEFNLTLCTEYLSEFSKHYVNQMNEYKMEAAESRRNNAHEIAKQVNLVIRTQMAIVRKEIEDLKKKFTMLHSDQNKYQFGLTKTFNAYDNRCFNGPLPDITRMLATMIAANAQRVNRALLQQEQRLLEEIRSQVDAKERRPRRHAVNGVRREKEITPGELIKEQSSSAKQLTSVIAAAIAPQVAQIKELLAAQDDVDDDAAINLLANDVSDASDNENADTDSLSN